MKRTWIAFALTAGLAACAPRGSSIPIKADTLAVIQANIKAAHDAGGDEDPRAASYLKRARDGVAEAEVKTTQGDNAAANVLINRAGLDAELALEVTRETKQRRNADATQASVQDAEVVTP